MKGLPVELFRMILHQLDLIDILNARLVSKDWNQLIVSLIKIEELHIVDNCSASKTKWFYSTKPFNYKYLIRSYSNSPLSFNETVNSDLFKIFSSIKFMNLDLKLSSNFNLTLIDEFKQLVQLEIGYLSIKNDRNLKSSSLNCLSIDFIDLTHSLTSKLFIDTPKLESFEIVNYYSDRIVFNRPETIKSLVIHYIYWNSEFNNLIEFKNLENFYCSLTRLPFNANTIFELQFLKKIFFFRKFRDEVCNFGRGFLLDLFDERRRLGRNDVEITINGQNLIDVHADRFGLDIRTKSMVKSMNSKNLQQSTIDQYVDGLLFCTSIQIDHLSILDLSRREDFFTKFNNIQEIETKLNLDEHQIETRSNFIDFLAKVKMLKKLTLNYPSIKSSDYYFQILNLCSLVSLELKEQNDIEIDYNFINKFKYLINLSTNQSLDFEFVFDSFAYSNYLNKISFKNNHHCYEIEKIDQANYRLQCCRKQGPIRELILEQQMPFDLMRNFSKSLRNIVITRSRKRKLEMENVIA